MTDTQTDTPQTQTDTPQHPTLTPMPTKHEAVITPQLLDHIKNTMQPQVVQISDPVTGLVSTSIFAPSERGNGGLTRHNIDSDIERLMARPRHLEGLAIFEDIESFIAHLNHFKNPDSVVFASKGASRFLSVIDYHQVQQATLVLPEGTPENQTIVRTPMQRHCRHGGVFAPKFSEAYLAWTGFNKKDMNQAQFADFLEDRVLDLHEPPAVNSENAADQQKLKIARMNGKTFATPAQMMDFRKGIKIHEASVAKSYVNTSTGEVEFEYKVEQQDEKGERVNIPGLFVIAIPVFDNSDVHYEVLVRLKYRMNGGKPTWFYELFRIDRVLESAFKDVKEKISKETGVMLLQGFPDSGPFGALSSIVPNGDVRSNDHAPSDIYGFWKERDRHLAEAMMSNVRTTIKEMF